MAHSKQMNEAGTGYEWEMHAMVCFPLVTGAQKVHGLMGQN